MAQKSYTVPNISCGHCVMSIKNELSEMEGVKSVEGDPDAKKITVDFDAPASEEKIVGKMKEINYPPS